MEGDVREEEEGDLPFNTSFLLMAAAPSICTFVTASAGYFSIDETHVAHSLDIKFDFDRFSFNTRTLRLQERDLQKIVQLRGPFMVNPFLVLIPPGLSEPVISLVTCLPTKPHVQHTPSHAKRAQVELFVLNGGNGSFLYFYAKENV